MQPLAPKYMAMSYVLVLTAFDQEIQLTMFLDSPKSQKLPIAGFWFQRPDLHRWTCFNSSGARKESDHVPVGGRNSADLTIPTILRISGLT